MRLQLAILTLGGLLMAVGSCGKVPAEKVLGVGDVHYVVPEVLVRGFVDQPDHKYIRIAPTELYRLVFSSRKNYRKNSGGDDVPTIADINDSVGDEFQVIREQGYLVVCRRELGLRFDCGIQIIDRDLKWSVQFDRNDLGQVQSISQDAISFLEKHRGS